MSLKKLALKGFIWTYAEQSGGQIINFFVNIILARTLFPNDFGVLGILYIFITIANVLVEGGMKTSIIRKLDANENDFSSVFFANIIISLIIYFIIFLLAPYISAFYDSPEFTVLLRVFSLTIIVQAFVFVQSAILTRNLDFRKQTLMKIPSILISSIIGIVLAYMGYGIWSLVWMYLTQAFFWALFHWVFSDWKPKLIFDKVLFKSHFNFGYRLTIIEILNTVTANINQIFIGKYYNISYVGYYTQSLTVRQLPISNIYGAASKLFLPIFSKIQHDQIKLINSYKQILSILIIVVAPILTFIAFFSEQIIVFLYSSKWKLAAPFLLFLSISGIFNVICNFNMNVISVIGDSKQILKMEILNKFQRFLFLALTPILMLSINSFLYMVLLTNIIHYFIANFYTSKCLKIKNSVLIFIFLRLALFSVISIFCTYFIYNYLLCNYNIFINYFVSIATGLVVYFFLLNIFNRTLINFLIDLFKNEI